jgi:integrase
MARPNQPPRIAINERGGWEVRYWNGKRTVRTSLGTQNEAEAKIRFGYWLVGEDRQDRPDLTVNDLLTLYWKEHVEPRSAAAWRTEYAIAHLRPHFGSYLPRELSPMTVHHYAEFRRAKPGTIRRELAALVAALNHGRKTGRLDLVPHIAMPAPPPPRDRWLDAAEVAKLLETAMTFKHERVLRRPPGETDEEARARVERNRGRMSRVARFIWIAVETGARKESICRLSWPQVDLERRVIDFRTPGKTQTKKRQVRVPISDRLLPILTRAKEERVSDLWVLDTPNSVRRGFAAVAKRAGLPGLHPHVLRHTAATHMAQAGVPLAMIAAVLGNTVAVVERTYAHWQSDALMKAVNYVR